MAAQGGDVSDLGDVDGRNLWRALATGEGEGRDEVLLELEGEGEKSALIAGRYKIVARLKGPNDEAHDRHVAPPQGEPPNSVDLDDLMMSSAAWKALQGALKATNSSCTSTSTRTNWRLEATVRCGDNNGSADAASNFDSYDTVYLFDIVGDPCETQNLASSDPELRDALLRKLAAYREALSPISGDKKSDERGYPEYHNCIWAPWKGVKPAPSGNIVTTLLLISPFCLVFLIFLFAIVGITTYRGDSSSLEATKDPSVFFHVSPNFRRGLAFSALDASHPNSTVARIPAMRKALKAVVAKKVVAMGVLNFTSDTSNSVSILKTLFQVLNETLRGKQNALTFLGIRIHSKQHAKNFVVDVQKINGLDCVLLQTHLSDAVSVTESCTSRLISYNNTPLEVPCFSNALEVQSALRDARSRLRVMFSSTLAAMVYVGASGQSLPTEAGQTCEYNIALDIDIICNLTSKWAYRTDRINVVETARYSLGAVPHFASFESRETLYKKMDAFLKYSSAGWAAFDIQHDVSAWCFSPDPYHRVQAMAFKLNAAKKKPA
ncbi:hypothetical protein HPB50_005754 [Hyalomma asiaticum]|uniref:Uncharacterized protein n=1 Tax=Hyalomma asiaticum TaxID=266040 RepID=A0ACB7RHX1_HYAAI|nr:hypothetical protein HPB50_005754 [Hyalomma asiaticum]